MANAELVNGGAGIWTFIYYTKCTSETSWQGRRVRGIPPAAQERYQSPVSRPQQHLRKDQSPVWLLALCLTPQPLPLPRLRPMWLGTVRIDPNRTDSLCWVSGSCLPGVKVRKLGFGLRAAADFSPVAEAGAEKT